jgi:outer membrane protein OmpA-like peptidoglycan-associated protein
MTIRADFHQYETLTKPDGAFFFDTGTNMRNDTAGKINDVETAYTSLFFGLQYDIRTGDNSKWLISPTITCNWGRSAIVQNYDWRASALMLGVQIKATSPLIKKVEEVYREDTIIDTLTVMSEDVIRNTIVTGKEHIDKYTKALDGKIIHTTVFSRTDTLYRRPVPRISVNINVPLINLEGQFVTQAFPLVPVVFFTKNSADLNTYYYTETNTDTFDIDIIKINALEYQKNLLNIIGKRMRKFLSSKLYIAAYCDSTTEGVNHKLAGKRANTIRQYLENKWTIKPSRLIVKPATGCNPPNATITRNDSGYADNRRAELFSDNPKLLSPVHNKRYIEPKAINPPLLIFDPSGSTSNGIARWALVIKKGEKVISQRSGNGFPGIFYDTLKTKDFTSLFSDIPLTVKFAMIDFEGQIGEVKREIPVKADTSEFELQRLSLILFKVGDETLSKKAKNDIREFLKDISNNSIIRVMGYTDPLGTPKLNKNLSRKRAENTAAFIKKILKGIKVEQSRGYASEAFPPGINSYSTPIERFLSRTVFIEILNKIK